MVSEQTKKHLESAESILGQQVCAEIVALVNSVRDELDQRIKDLEKHRDIEDAYENY